MSLGKKEMEKLCEELDTAKAEIEKLVVHLKCKSELLENLRRVHSEQLVQIQEANSKIEKQGVELNAKEEEILALKQSCEDLEYRLNEKKSLVRDVSTRNDKLRVDFGQKFRRWEEEKRGLVLALDEANEKNIDLEQKIHVFRAEIDGLKSLLSTSEKKVLEAEKKSNVQKEMREKYDVVFKLEKHTSKVEEQLKWKKEQFKHLEEAYEKLQNQFKGSKKEWEIERSKLIDETCSLQTSLESQTRISKDFQSKLSMCSQALVREESRRKFLEAEVSDFKSKFENLFSEWQDAKSQLGSLASERDKDIAMLRHSLDTKEAFYKEIKYQAKKLDQENQELLASLRELQEVQIQESGNFSGAKLRNKLNSIEKVHRDCSATLRTKEAEWSARLQAVIDELNNSKSELESKDTAIKELDAELANCQSVIIQLKLQSEETSIMLLVLKSGIEDAKLSAANAEEILISRHPKRDEKISVLMKQLGMKETALAKAVADINEEREKASFLMENIESLEHVEEQRLLLENELRRCKEMLEKSSVWQTQFKEQALQMEMGLKEKIRAACDSLDIVNAELAKEHSRAELLSRKAESVDHLEEKQAMLQKDLDRYKELAEESCRQESDLKEKLREVCDALGEANSQLDKEHAHVESLSMKVENYKEMLDQQQFLIQKEVEKHKEMLEESHRNQLFLEKQALHVENDLKETLREVSEALDSANSELAEEREKTASLSRRLKDLDDIQEQRLLMQKEIEKYKEMLDASSKHQHKLERQIMLKESEFRGKLQEVCDILDEANSELTAKTFEGHAVEFELWIWKYLAQRLKDDLEESQVLRKELEASLLAQVNVGESFKQERDDLIQTSDMKDSELVIFTRTMREKDELLTVLQKEVEWLEHESLTREFESALWAKIGTEKTFELEKENLIQLLEERDQKYVRQAARSLEQTHDSSLFSLSSELDEKKAEICFIRKAWGKIAVAEVLARVELEEKSLMVTELDDEISSIQQKLERQEESLSCAKQHAVRVETALEMKQMEMTNLINQMQMTLIKSEASVEKLENEKEILLQDLRKLSTEKKSLLALLEGFGDRISQVALKDMKLSGKLEEIVQSLDIIRPNLGAKENLSMSPNPSPNTAKLFQAVAEERSPFRELK